MKMIYYDQPQNQHYEKNYKQNWSKEEPSEYQKQDLNYNGLNYREYTKYCGNLMQRNPLMRAIEA